MKLIKFLIRLYKDEAGNFFEDLFGGGEYETYDPYAEQRKKLSDYLTGKLGTSTQYQPNPAFDIPQPDIEKQTESVVSKRLGSLPSAEEYKSKVEAAKTSEIEREKSAADEQVNKERDMYNRLGLASSTPWMSRAGELGEESLTRQGDISSKYDMYGLDYNLQADQLADQIAKGWTAQGQTLGTTQRAGSQFGAQMSLQDLIRQIEEEQGYSNQLGGFLGQNPATTEYSPGMGEQLLGVGADILPYLLMMGGLGAGTAGTAGTGLTGAGGSSLSSKLAGQNLGRWGVM